MDKVISLTEAVKAFEAQGVLMRGIRYAAGRTLNDLAFKGRGEIQAFLRKSHTIRQPGIIRAKVVYRKTVRSRTIDGLESSVGSTADSDGKPTAFTGWFENEEGRADLRRRKWNKRARTGSSEGRPVRKKYRFIPGREIPSYDASDGSLAKFTAILAHEGYYNQPFMITDSKNKKIPDGVYIIKKKRKLKKQRPTQQLIRIADRNEVRFDRKKPFTPEVYDMAKSDVERLFSRRAREALEFQNRVR